MQKLPPKSAPVAGEVNTHALDRVFAVAPAPLLPGEEGSDYKTLAARIVGAAAPRDAIEDFLVRDVVDLTWEALRLRRLKAGILKASMSEGVQAVMSVLGQAESNFSPLNRRIGTRWASGDKNARKEVDAALAEAGLTLDEVTAKTLERKIETYERIDRTIASAEARRNNALREIVRHREALGATDRRVLDEPEDVPFQEIGDGEIDGAKLS
jgi:hypothetical protein